MDFLSFFGLKEDPFKLTPDPAFFYPSQSHNEGLLLMDYAIEQKEGFLIVIGDPGTGKTTMLRVFLEKWNTRAEIAMILTPRLSPEEFLVTVAEDFKISTGIRGKNEIIKALRSFMTEKTLEDNRVIIIVDEAQNLPDETLEELRLLSNLETDKDKLIQIVLLGQPELEVKLSSDRLRQLNQRITTRIHLKHFNLNETVEYINYRIIKAGKENLQIHKNAGKLAYRLSNGVPRLINMLISRALMAAFLEEKNVIMPGHIKHAVKSLNNSEIKVKRYAAFVTFSVALVLLAVGIPAYYYFQSIDSRTSAELLKNRDNDKMAQGAADKGHSAENIAEQYSKPDNAEFNLLSVKVDVAILRNRPSTESGKAGWIPKGSQLVVLSESYDENNTRWYQVSYRGMQHWISEEVVELIELEGDVSGDKS